MIASPVCNEVTAERKTSASKFHSARETEDILAVPRIWTKKAYQLLIEYNAVPRPWHFEGRWGSRTHKVDDERMGFPIISRRNLEEKALEHPAIQELLAVEGVSILTDQPFVVSHRAKDPVFIDATIHPERARRAQNPQTTTETVSQVFPRDSSKEPPLFTYAELFAGIGGFGVALEALGGQCIFVSELEEQCRETYMANFDTPHQHIHGDIYQVKDSQFPEPGSLDLLVGGFPCQPFSSMSTQPGMECETGRGLLFQEIVRVLKISKPKAFLLENVPGLYGMQETFEFIVRAFEDPGYRVVTEVCSSRGLTATSRKRLFFVGLRNDLVDHSSPTDNTRQDIFEFPFVPDLRIKSENIMDYDELPPEELAILRLVDETMDRLVNSGRWRSHSLAWPNRPCDTITSHYGNAVGRGESQLVPSCAPHHPRRFSIRECARLMGFPNSYRLVPQKSTQGDMAYRKLHYRMFGNAVCPPLIAALAGAVLHHCRIPDSGESIDWTEKGTLTAKALSKAATRSEPASLPMGCLVLNGGN